MESDSFYDYFETPFCITLKEGYSEIHYPYYGTTLKIRLESNRYTFSLKESTEGIEKNNIFTLKLDQEHIFEYDQAGNGVLYLKTKFMC